MARQDLESGLIETEIWTTKTRREALDEMYEHYMRHAKGAAQWYGEARVWKRRLGRGSRAGALALVGLAGITPFFADPIPLAGTGLVVQVPPLATALFFGLAAGLVGLDRFFGWTTGWTRYVLTGTRVQHALDDFQIQWQTDIAAWAQRDPTDEELAKQLAKLREFVADINGMVRAETEAWIAEFQAASQTVDSRVNRLQVK